MARKAKASNNPEVNSGTVAEATPEASGAVYATAGDGASSLAGASITPKLALPLTESGAIDLASLRASTREKLTKALEATPELRPATGTPLSEKDCAYIYGLLGNLEKFCAAKFMGLPEDLADRIMGYSDEDVKELTEPTREVAAKYGMAVMSPEVRLLIALTSINMRKFLQVKLILAQQKAKDAQIERARVQ